MAEIGSYCLPCRLNKEEAPRTATLYRFPTCPTRRKLWLGRLGLEEDYKIKMRSRVCEHHFHRDQRVRTRLKKDAVPAGPYKLSFYKGPALESLRRARELEVRSQRQVQIQPQPQQPILLPKLEAPKTLDFVIQGQPVILAKWNNSQSQGEDDESEAGSSSGSILEPKPSPAVPLIPATPAPEPTSSKKLTTYAIPAVIYIEVDELGRTQKTTVVPQGQAVIHQPTVAVDKAPGPGNGS